jgi:hypothetical protein
MNSVITARRFASTLALAGAVCFAGAASAASVKVPEGTEMRVRFDEMVTSKTAAQGDQFSITLAENVMLADGSVLPAGYKGVGEVTNAEKRGMMGKGGELNVRFNYIKVGDQRLRLRGSKGAEGKDAVGATVALTVLFGPIGLIKKGKDVEIVAGQEMTVYADGDAVVEVADAAVVPAAAPAPAADPAATAPAASDPAATAPAAAAPAAAAPAA